MVQRYLVTFHEVATPIREPVTKFGGQPVWIDRPAWPTGRKTGRPMRFICQVALDPLVFGIIPTRMAYLFMTDEEEFVDGTYEPEGGENAVVIQSGEGADTIPAQVEGLTLYRMVEQPRRDRLVAVP